MRATFTVCTALLLNTAAAFAQQGNSSPVTLNGQTQSIQFHNAQGLLIPVTYPNVQGTAYWKDDYTAAYLVLAENKSVDRIPAKMDLYKQQVQVYLEDNHQEAVFSKGTVRRVIFYDTLDGLSRQRTFQLGFPAIDEQDSLSFYEVLTPGKATLLHYRYERLGRKKVDFSVDYVDCFYPEERKYVLVNGQMKKLKKNNVNLLDILSDKKQELMGYIKEKHLNVEEDDDMSRIVKYYNLI
jgi:hypothetical protein